MSAQSKDFIKVTNTTHLTPAYSALIPQQDRQAEWTKRLTQAHNNLAVPLSDPMIPDQLESLRAALKASHKILGEFNEQIAKKYITVPRGGWKYNLPAGKKVPSQTLDSPFAAVEALKVAIKVMKVALENVKNGWWAMEGGTSVRGGLDRDDGEEMNMGL